MILYNFGELDWLGNDKFTDKSLSNLFCQFCGMTFHEYRHKQLLGCANCYHTFGNKLLEEMQYNQKGANYYGRGVANFSQGKSVTGKEGLPFNKEKQEPWYLTLKNNDSHIISTRLRLARNVVNYSFPHYLQNSQARQLYQSLAETFMNVYPQAKDVFIHFNMENMDNFTKQSLVEKRLISPQFANQNRPCFLIIRKDEQISIMLGEEDHIRIQVLSAGQNLFEAYAEAERIAVLFEQQVNIAFDKKLGFLTSCTTNTGTGMRASLMIHLPFLSTHPTFPIILKKLNKIGLTVRGDHGENTEAEGSLFQVSNQTTLGISCEQSLMQLLNVVEQLISKEKELQNLYLKENLLQLYDRVSRSLAILKNSYLLSHKECIKHSSNFRLAIELGLIDNSQQNNYILNKLTYCMGAFSLQKEMKTVLADVQRDFYRASYLRELLKDIVVQPNEKLTLENLGGKNDRI